MSNYELIIPAFLAGLLSFLSPCILPIFPIFFSMLTKNLESKFSIIFSTLYFCLGFTLSFVLLGATATFFGNLLNENFSGINNIFSCIIIVLGLHSLGIIRIPILEKTLKIQLNNVNFFTSILLGFIFGFGWSPCTGPILGSILMIAATKETIFDGMFLLSIYSLGIAVPFIVFSLFFSQLECIRTKINRYSEFLYKISGILLISFGLYMFLK